MRIKLISVIAIHSVLLIGCGGSSNSATIGDGEPIDTVEPSEPSILDSQIDGLVFGNCERVSSDFEPGSLANPTGISAGIVLGGSSITLPGDFVTGADYWRLEAPAGIYVVLAEVFRVSSRDNATRNLTVAQLGDDDSPIIEIDELDSFSRQIAVVEVDAESNVFEVALSEDETGSYDLAFYSIDDSIPTPEIVGCGPMSVTSIGTTESFNIRDIEDNQYFFLNGLPVGAYRLTLSASAVAGDPETSGITVSINNESNDHRTERSILVHESIDAVSSTDVEFSQSQTGDLLLRFSQPPSEQTIEFTLELL